MIKTITIDEFKRLRRSDASDKLQNMFWRAWCDASPHNLPEREFRFSEKRRFRFDFAWPKEHVAVEIDGGNWINGGHNTGNGYQSGCEKLNLAATLGWTMLRFTGKDVTRKMPYAIETVCACLNRPRGEG